MNNTIEIKKDALRQNQDGTWKITFTVHPQDMSVDLMTSPMGTRYYAQLQIAEEIEEYAEEKPMTSQKAVMLTKDIHFQEFVKCNRNFNHITGISDELLADKYIKDKLGISSKSELNKNPDFEKKLNAIYFDYRSWLDRGKY